MIRYLKDKLHSFAGYRGIFDCDCACAAPPNYDSTAKASEEAARLSKELGDAQLAEAKRQYDQNFAVAKPVADAQLGLMNSQREQGDDYYNYNKETYRPLEKSMVEQAQRESSDEYAEQMAAQASADARAGQTQQMNSLVRQGLRYGFSPNKLSAMAAAQAGANASSVAGATSAARTNQKNVGWARQMDAAGLGRNLTGASQGAYGLSINAGNSAVNNTMQPGNQLLTAQNQANGTIMQGQGQRIQGLGSVMNAQASVYNNSMQQQGGSGLGGLGSLLGGAAQMYGAWNGSDRRLKKNIEKVGVDEQTGLNLYEFEYKDGDGKRYRGVMADEVEKVVPKAVTRGEDGMAMVDYGMLGIEMVEV